MGEKTQIRPSNLRSSRQTRTAVAKEIGFMMEGINVEAF